MQYLSDHATFANTQELNHHVKLHEKYYADVLTATVRNTLRFISRYAVKYPGAAHLKTSTIAEHIGKSERTVRRILSVLEKLNVISRTITLRKKTGGNGANIIVILPFDEAAANAQAEAVFEAKTSARMSARQAAEKSDESKLEHAESENETLYKLTSNNYVLDTAHCPTALRQTLPQGIYEVMAPYFNADGLYKTYGILLRAKAKAGRSIAVEDHIDIYTDIFRNAVRKLKAGKIRNLDGYLYRCWKRASEEIQRRKVFNVGATTLAFDWLAED